MKILRPIRTTASDTGGVLFLLTLVLYLVFGNLIESHGADKKRVYVSFLAPNLVVISEVYGETLGVSVYNIDENSMDTVNVPDSTLNVLAVPGGTEEFSLMRTFRPVSTELEPDLYIARQSGRFGILEISEETLRTSEGRTPLGFSFGRVMSKSKIIIGEVYMQSTNPNETENLYARDVVLSIPSLEAIDNGEPSAKFTHGFPSSVSPTFGDNDEFVVIYKQALFDSDSPFLGQFSIFRLNPFELEGSISVGDGERLMAYANSQFKERCYAVFRNKKLRKFSVLQITAIDDGAIFTESAIEVLGNTDDALALAWSENFEVWSYETSPGLVAIPRSTGESSRIVLSQELQSDIVFSDTGEYLLSVNSESGAVSLWHFDKEPVLLNEDITK